MIAMRLAAIGFLASAAAHLLSFTPWARLLPLVFFGWVDPARP